MKYEEIGNPWVLLCFPDCKGGLMGFALFGCLFMCFVLVGLVMFCLVLILCECVE